MSEPTKMPAWLEKQFDNAEKTVQTWSEGKRKAAGIPPDHIGDANEMIGNPPITAANSVGCKP